MINNKSLATIKNIVHLMCVRMCVHACVCVCACLFSCQRDNKGIYFILSLLKYPSWTFTTSITTMILTIQMKVKESSLVCTLVNVRG